MKSKQTVNNIADQGWHAYGRLSVYVSVCLSVCLSASLSVCLSVCLSVYLQIIWPVCLFVMYLCVRMYENVSIFLYVRHYVHRRASLLPFTPFSLCIPLHVRIRGCVRVVSTGKCAYLHTFTNSIFASCSYARNTSGAPDVYLSIVSTTCTYEFHKTSTHNKMFPEAAWWSLCHLRGGRRAAGGGRWAAHLPKTTLVRRRLGRREENKNLGHWEKKRKSRTKKR